MDMEQPVAAAPAGLTGRAQRNGSRTEQRVAALEEQMQVLAWLHTEKAAQVIALAQALAAMLAQAYQPQVQNAITARLLGGQPPLG
jgi:hypothetical protein